MKYEFFMNMTPPTVTHPSCRKATRRSSVTVRNGKPIFFEDTALKNARASFMANLARFRPAEPSCVATRMRGAVRLLTKWCFAGKTAEPRYKITKPDTDNMIKLLKDCMTRSGFWADDAQVAELPQGNSSRSTEKFVVPNRTGIYVYVEEMEELK